MSRIAVSVEPQGFVVHVDERSSDCLDLEELGLQLRSVAGGAPHYPMLTAQERHARDLRHLDDAWKHS